MNQNLLLGFLHISEKLNVFDIFRGSGKVTLTEYALEELALCTYGSMGYNLYSV